MSGLDKWIMSHTTSYVVNFALTLSLAAMERNPRMDAYSGSPCVTFIHIILTGVVA